jgi:60 kDa SS-A/Ro ribonucleoprotein
VRQFVLEIRTKIKGKNMSKFNTNTKTQRKVKDTVNAAGHAGFSRNSYKNEIASIVMNSMLNGDSYYESDEERIKNIENIMVQNLNSAKDAEFLAKAMVYTRLEGNMRSVSHLMGTILAENVKGSNFLRPALRKTMKRPDDATEMVALYSNRNFDKMVPNVLRRAIKDSLETKWDEYQLKKYAGESNTVKLKDVVKLTHPNPRTLVETGKAKDPFVFKRVIESTLDNIQTAQTVNAGSTGEARASNYKAMLAERKLGYMAALKNIRNILESGADEQTVDMLCGLLGNERAVLNSGVLPFRFTQAYNEVKNMNMDRILNKKVLRAIEDGFMISARNVPIVEDGESCALLLDESGSMGGGWGYSNSDQSPFMIGKTLMASMLCGLDHDKTVGYLWADNAREVSIEGRPFDFIERTRTQGFGTNVAAAFDGLLRTKTKVDKIVIITDMQHNSLRNVDNTIRDYRRLVNPNVKVLFWNVQGYGKGTPVKISGEVMEMSGYSDKMLEVAAKMMKYSDASFLIKEIEAVTLN